MSVWDLGARSAEVISSDSQSGSSSKYSRINLSLEAQVRLMRLSLSIPKSPSLGLGVELRDLLLKARPLYTPADISLSNSWSHLQIPPVRTRLTSCAAGVLDFWTTVHAFSASAILLQNLPVRFFPSSLQTRHFLRLRSSRYSFTTYFSQLFFLHPSPLYTNCLVIRLVIIVRERSRGSVTWYFGALSLNISKMKRF